MADAKPVERIGATVADALRALSSDTGAGFTFESSGGARVLSFAALSAEAARRAYHLLAAGLERGDPIALIIPDPEDFILALLGAFVARLVPVPLYPPLVAARPDVYLASASHILRTAGARAIVTASSLAPVLAPLMPAVPGLRQILTTEALAAAAAAPFPDPGDIQQDRVAFLQFTSGSTAAPKGTRVTHANIAANCHAIAVDSLQLRAGDKGVTWLPLYHDMGLVGFVLLTVLYGVPVVFIPTLHFVRRPASWMRAVHDHRGTITFGPNFAMALLLRLRPPDDLDLSCLRVLGCGAEPIQPETVRRFVAHFAPAGLRPDAILPCYGMAEATLAISFSALSDRLRTDVVAAAAYAESGRAVPAASGATAVREFVSCGRVIPGHSIAIVDEAGNARPDRTIGEVLFQGPSVAAGYHNNPDATRQTFTAGGLMTGDLGYLADGELFITGRKKDLLILNGRNYDPQFVEGAVEEVAGVRRGHVVAFTRPGPESEELIVAVETTRADGDAVADEIRRHVNGRLQLRVADVIILASGSLPKTSSGKLQRSKVRERYLLTI